VDEERTFLLVINSSGPSLPVARASLRVNRENIAMNTVVARFLKFLKDESGATAIEYGLIAAIVAVGIIIGLQNLRDGLNTLFNNIDTNVTSSH
jgi:pilus assembly protein Flp/PilA